MTHGRSLLPLLLASVLGACAGLPSSGGGPGNSADIAAIIEPGMREAAEQAEQRNDHVAAANQYRSLLARKPQDAGIRLALARNLRYAGNTAEAISTLIDQSQGNPQLVAELGKSYLAADRLPLAIKTLEEADRLAPGNWETLSALGVANDQAGNYDAAQAHYRAALALSPDNPVLLNNLGLSQAQSGRLAEAVATLEQAANQPRATAQVRQNLALLQALAGDADAAERTARSDLTPDQQRANAAIYKQLSGGRRMVR